MPKTIPNWWIRAAIEGRASILEGGPVREDGGFTLRIFQRDEERVVEGLRVEGFAHSDGTLRLSVSGLGTITDGEYLTHRDQAALPAGREEVVEEYKRTDCDA